MHDPKCVVSTFLCQLGLAQDGSKLSNTCIGSDTLNCLRALAGATFQTSIDNLMPYLVHAQEESMQKALLASNVWPIRVYALLSYHRMMAHFRVFMSSWDRNKAREVFEHSLALASLTGLRDLPILTEITTDLLLPGIIMAYLADCPTDFPSALQAITELGTSAAAFLLHIHGQATIQDFHRHARSLQCMPLPYPKFLFHVISAVIINSPMDKHEATLPTIIPVFEITPAVINDLKDFSKCSDVREYYYRCMVLHYIQYARFLHSTHTSDLYESLSYRLSANAIFPNPLTFECGSLDRSFLQTIYLKFGDHDQVLAVLGHYAPTSHARAETVTNLDVIYETIFLTGRTGAPMHQIQRAKVSLMRWMTNGYQSEALNDAAEEFQGVASHPSTTAEERQVAQWWLAFIRSNPDPHLMDNTDMQLEVFRDGSPFEIKTRAQRMVKRVVDQWWHAGKTGDLFRLVELLPLLQATMAMLDTNSVEFELCKNLGSASIKIAEKLGEPNPEVLKKIRQKLSEMYPVDSLEELRAKSISTTEGTFQRLRFARDWAQRSFKQGLPEAVDAFQTYASLLQDNIHIGSMAEHKHQILTSEPWVQHWSDTAVSVVVKDGNPDRLPLAVEFLEQSRSITYRHFFQLRKSNTQLSRIYPDLEKRWLHLCSQIRDAFRTGTRSIHHLNTPDGRDFVRFTMRGLEERHNRLLKEIREKPGFECFLRPLKYGELSQAAVEGPVIMLSSDPQTGLSHALIIIPNREQPVYLQLPEEVSFSEVSRNTSNLVRLLGGEEPTRRGWELDTKPSDNDSLSFHRILDWLWDGVVFAVFSTLNMAGYTSGRVWWCPSGNFTLLPLHAAAMLDPTYSFVSSYTPSLEALIESRRREPVLDDTKRPRRLAAIGLQSCPRRQELHPLYAVKNELDFLIEDGRERYRMVEGNKFEDCNALVESVLDAIKSSHIVHLACHGVQDSSDPLNSHFILYDGELSLRDIMDENMSCAEFAFLSACQTATGTKELANESLHLTGGFIAAGFKGVVGTLWSIVDRDSPRVVRKVYERMATEEGGFDVRKAAEGLHRAVQGMIKQGLPPRRWAPFIHVGI